MLFVLSRGQLGGAERSTIAALRHRPADIEARAVLLSPGADERELQAIGVPTLAFPEFPATVRGRARVVRLLDRELAAFSPDLIHATGNKAALASVLPSNARRIPLVWSKCDSWYDGRGAAMLARGCRRVLAPSNACGAAVPARRLAVIDPVLPIDPAYAAPAGRPPATIGSVGRLEPHKGHHDVIVAAGLIRDRVDQLRVIVVGGDVPYAPGYRDTLRAAAAMHGVGDRVKFIGQVPGIEPVLSRLTLLASASYRDSSGHGGEAFGLAIAEAGWAGLPVVVTNSGGETEHVRDGVNGLVVPPRDPRRLAAAMLELLDDPARAQQIGAQAARLAHERFDPDRTAARLFAELRSCAVPRS